MKTKYLVALFPVLVALSCAYPRLKAIKWMEPTKKAWYGPTDILQKSYYVEYLPSGEQKQLGTIYNAGYGWEAYEFDCGILWHTRAYATKEMAMRAIEKWCGKPAQPLEQELNK